jgi:hypothetical protein
MNGSILLKDFLTKCPDELIPGGFVRLNQFPGNLVCIDDISALFF